MGQTSRSRVIGNGLNGIKVQRTNVDSPLIDKQMRARREQLHTEERGR